MIVSHLTCDGMRMPLGYDFHKPALSWICQSDAINDEQTSYRIEIGLDERLAVRIWDSGVVYSPQSVNVQPEISLAPLTRYFWRVSVTSRSVPVPVISAVSWFETGRYNLPWRGKFISGPFELPQLKREFTLQGAVRRARLYACGVGLYQMFINGKRASDEELAPGFCAYDDYLPYQTYDVTALLRPGANVLGAWLGKGYYLGRVNWPGMEERRCIYGNEPAIIAELVLEYQDDTCETIFTDEHWQAAPSPFRRAEIYDGEIFDRRLGDASLFCPGRDFPGAMPAHTVSIDQSLLRARINLPVRVKETRSARLIHTPGGDTLLDFGQNAAGRIRVKGCWPAGTEICLQTGEELDAQGELYRENLRTALSEQIYISDGQPCDYAPFFTFFGFRYARVKGLCEVDPACFTMEVLYSDMERIGDFTCSDPLVNRLFLNAMWGQKSNFVDNPTDCPQRDERMGWTGDAQVFAPTACMNMDAQVFFRKYLHDLALEQKKTGFVPVTVPNILRGTNKWQIPTTGWCDAAVLIPWTLYLHYGDPRVLEAQYESMRDWVDYISAQDKDQTHLYGGFHLGDWLAQDTKDADNRFGLTPTGLIATAFYALSADILSRSAELLHYESDARRYGELAEKIRAAFRREYVAPSGRVASETQTAYVIALIAEMLLPEQRAKAASLLAERLRIDHVTLTTGFLGTPYICPVLSQNGLNEYAYALLLQKKYPSWLFEVEMGATTLWERWNSLRADRSFGPVSMNSFNHYAFGSIAQWLYQYAAGIRPQPDGAGFQRFTLAPLPNSLLQSACATLRSPYGLIASRWDLGENEISLEFTIPFNTQAQITLPDCPTNGVLENGIPLPAAHIPFTRGSGKWVYRYTPTGESIHRRVPDPQPLPF